MRKRDLTKISVVCDDCNLSYDILLESYKKKATGKRQCLKCRAKHGANSVRGKPASNRLPNSIGGFNLLFNSYIKAAENRKLQFDLTKEEFFSLTKHNCFYCGTEPKQEYKSRKGNAEPFIYNGIDRLNSNLGYNIENCVPCCSKCNYMKQELDLQDFLGHVQKILEHTQTVPPRSGKLVFYP